LTKHERPDFVQHSFNIYRKKANMTVTAEVLRELHRLHQQLAEVRGRLLRGPRQIKGAEAAVERLAEVLDAAKKSCQRMRMSSDEKELQLKEREGRIQDVRLKLNSATNNKEYQAFIEQIAADDQANSVLSDEILELLDKVSDEQAKVATAEENLNKGKEELAQANERVASSQAKLESELGRLETELTEAEKALPQEVLADYQRVAKAHGEETLAPVEENEICGGCFQKITSQMVNELAMSKIVFCKTCGRLLYLPEDTSP
jgi:predicted  nucleic acid-binding Zn-ribbon protein